MTEKVYNLNGIAGLVEQHRNQLTGTVTSIYHAEQSQLADPNEGGKWLVLCEDHGGLMQTDRRSIAEFYRPFPCWCEECAEGMGVEYEATL